MNCAFHPAVGNLKRSGITPGRELAVIGQQSSNKRLGDVLNQVAAPSLKGIPFPMHYSIFPRFRFALSYPGKSGRKERAAGPVLEKLADYNENRQKIRSKLISH